MSPSAHDARRPAPGRRITAGLAVACATALLAAPAHASNPNAGQAPNVALSAPAPIGSVAAGVLRVQSSYGFDDTVARLRATCRPRA